MNLFLLILLYSFSQLSFANILSEQETKIEVETSPEQSIDNIEFDIDDQQKPQNSSYFPHADSLFENPTFVTGLKTTTDLLNRSVESLMESIFYSLLDQTFKTPLTNSFFLSSGTERKVYIADKGAYVVVDRVFYGPGYEKKLGHINKIPVNLGSQAHTDIFNIYLRSDGQRLEEKREKGHIRYFINNLFGFLPLLTKVLPPSFNPNELYDPLHLIETPFLFPFDKDKFKSMLIGSVRSYQLSGGVSLPLDLAMERNATISDFLDKNGAVASLPYMVFVRGEHRINVMRREENLAWVGLTRSNKTGHSLSGFIGNTYNLLKNSLKVVPWNGVPVSFFPIDLELSKALVSKNNILFAFKMDHPIATEAYREAVRGNFAPAFELSKKPEKNGVTYHFSSETDSLETKTEVKNSYFVLKNDLIGTTEQAEIKLEDRKGVSYILEGSKILDQTSWDMLIGQEKTLIKSAVTMQVNRKQKLKVREKLQYKYEFKNKEPYHLIFNLDLNDRAADAEEYKAYLKLLRKFSLLPLEELSEIPFRSKAKLRKYRMRSFFAVPGEPPRLIHVTPTTLGKLDAHAQVHISYKQIMNILNKPKQAWWQAIGKAFELSEDEIKQIYEGSTNAYLLSYGRQAILSPLKLINFNFYQVDALSECLHFTSILTKMKLAQSPTELLTLFTEFFTTNYPDKRVLALLYLAELKETPRRVSLFVKPASSLDPGLKEHFRKINQMVFTSEESFPNKKRYEIAQDKITAFFPGQLNDLRDKPILTKIAISIDQSSKLPPKPILVKIRAKKVPFDSNSSVYIRLQTTGNLQIGNYTLGETILQLKANAVDITKKDLDEGEFKFFLTGPKSPFTGFFFEQMTQSGGRYLLTISLSTKESIWTKKKTVKFQYRNGNVFPITD